MPATGTQPGTAHQQPDTLGAFSATWRSGYAAACKAVYTGSIPVVAFMQRACKTALFGVLAAAPRLPKTANELPAAAPAGLPRPGSRNAGKRLEEIHAKWLRRSHASSPRAAKTVALKRGKLTAIFKLGPRTAAHALIRVSAKLDHELAVTSTLRRHAARRGG
jgi:hypothetical protein